MDVNEELKFFVKIQKKKFWEGGGGGSQVWGGRVYKKVLYNIEKMKKCWGGRERGNI